jgi:hypothetical protein
MSLPEPGKKLNGAVPQEGVKNFVAPQIRAVNTRVLVGFWRFKTRNRQFNRSGRMCIERPLNSRLIQKHSRS